MDRTAFIARLDQIKAAVLTLDAKIYSWEIGEPASMETICAIEKKYQIKLPADYVDIATQIAGKVDIVWSIFENESFLKRHPQFQSISGGTLQWDIEHYLSEKVYQGYLYYTSHWENMRGLLDFAEVPNGDMILFNLANTGEKKPVVYLNHDGLYSYPVQLAECFGDYVESLLQIGLVGNEIWQLEKFIQPEPEEKNGKPCIAGSIDPECNYALAWRKLMGLL